MAERGKWLERAARRRQSRSLLRKVLRRGFFVLLAFLTVFTAGFLQFADTVASLQPPATPKADAIVVLTGGFQRIDQAVDLLKLGAGKRLLISGVHPSTTRSQIRRNTQSSADLFKCCVDIGHAAIDTIGNATETSLWIRNRGYRTILVVTNNYHMPRSLLELRRARPETEFIAYPVVNSDLKTTNWLRNPLVLKAILLEYGKYSVATLRDVMGARWTNGLRSGPSHIAPAGE
ncbi:YdcF family protein [Sinorhizobium meliloti]|uniref:YdcF family protein n=1 Tax=Rhizobium meliloti TaxID=382 RepID=UPI000D1E9F96|nr:YdcF family protein [Sinorhizobium meliloti]MDW9416190.1 YdcF family protein [Sinorhizobium meliloti]MDW9479773.1 YdcF family protein [Sinorhizobium meliloti]MDW9512785.1 YdcF family protein [Sinorhizobium meliloti]MDW9593602.1 YdcF family protein [Sinorhizobium meliloti]MDW9638457.1 YdcF family protein [Sinorhizobium meliloti]